MTIKSTIQSIVIIATLIVLHACGQNDKATQKEINAEPIKEVTHADYKCPMDCEKGKIYHEPGKCPVCQMDLAKIEHKENERHEHDVNADDTTHREKHKHKEGDDHKH